MVVPNSKYGKKQAGAKNRAYGSSQGEDADFPQNQVGVPLHSFMTQSRTPILSNALEAFEE